jgi:hypothetical protein
MFRCCTVPFKRVRCLKYWFLRYFLRVDVFLCSTTRFFLCLNYVRGFMRLFTYYEDVRDKMCLKKTYCIIAQHNNRRKM